MSKASSRIVVAPSPAKAWLAGGVTAALSLAILLSPHVGRAAVAPKDADLVGKWMADKNDPNTTYSVLAGPSAGTLRILVPAKAVGRPKGEDLLLKRDGPNEFATAKDAPIRARFKVSDPRHATFQMIQNDKKSFGFGYLLLEKQ